MSRKVTHSYRDPLDEIWLETARRIGFQVARTRAAYASTDGNRTLLIGAPDTLDPDDCLAQMIFHELCHSLVEGPESLARPDWGLDNETDRDVPREHACLRLQARLAAEVGLRELLAPTTEHRAFYDALPEDPFSGDDPTVDLARAAFGRVDDAPWGPHLRRALSATARIVEIVAPFAGSGSLYASRRTRGKR